MKPCHKHHPSPRSVPAASCRRTSPAPPAARSASQTPPVHRYVHPIRSSRSAPRSSVEELLADMLEALSRQSDQLDAVLRRLGGDNSDTM